jgi:hypothetical protein
VDDNLKKAAVACLQILNKSADPERLTSEDLQAIIDKLQVAGPPLSVEGAAVELRRRREQ